MTRAEVDRQWQHELARKMLLDYQSRRPHRFFGSGAQLQGYQNWRARWLCQCLSHMPDWNYTSECNMARHDVAVYGGGGPLRTT